MPEPFRRRPARRIGAAVLFAAILAPAVRPQAAVPNFGVVISEIAHGPSLPPVAGNPMPSFIELVNLEIANPVVPPIVPLAGMNVTVTVNGSTVTFPMPALIPGTPPLPPVPFVPPVLGGNVQPPPAAQPVVPPVEPAVFLLAAFPFPPGVVPAGVQVFIAPFLFNGPLAAFASAGAATEVCIHVPSINHDDQLVVPPALPAAPCQTLLAPFTVTGALNNTSGKVVRWTYVDSETDIDFDGGFAISPGVVNPAMSHVDGFLFGPPGGGGAVDAGAPLVLAGPIGAFSVPTAVVTGIKFHNANPPYDRVVTNPVFDRALGAPATITGNYVSVGPSFPTAPNYFSGLILAGSSVVITAPPGPGGGSSGVLSMPNAGSSLVDLYTEPDPAVPGQVRIARVYTDGLGDSGTTGSGDASDAQRDTIPGSTGGGNVWCEVVIYDAAGNKYKGKAKNWPPSPGSATPRLSLGTSGSGDGLLVDDAFDPLTEIYNVFSMTPAATCGVPLLAGLCPDALMLAMISPPYPLGVEPFHFLTDVDGVYAWSVAAPAMLAFAGITFEGIAVGFSGGSFYISQPASVTF